MSFLEVIMRKRIFSFAIFSMLLSHAVIAADEATPVAPNTGIEPKAAPKSKLNAKAIKPMRTGCWTNVRDCAGSTTYGPFQEDMGCAVWWNDGAGGVRNFTLRAGQTETENVRFNDTGACVAIRSAPPNYNNGRFYLWVK